MKLLIVDDNEELVEQLVADFTENGFTCETATSGVDGLSMLINNKYDAAVVDISLPELRGDKLILQAEKWNMKTPIIVITGIQNEKIKDALVNNQIFSYVEKPFKFSDLLVIVEEAASKKD